MGGICASRDKAQLTETLQFPSVVEKVEFKLQKEDIEFLVLELQNQCNIYPEAFEGVEFPELQEAEVRIWPFAKLGKDGRGFETILQSLKTAKELKKFSLSVTGNDEFNDKLVTQLADSLCMWKLKSFELLFSKNQKISSNSNLQIVLSLATQYNLEELRLKLSQAQDSWVKAIIEALKQMPNLKVLNLDFTNNTEITNQGYQTFAEFLKQDNSIELEKLQIGIYDATGCDQRAEETLETIKEKYRDAHIEFQKNTSFH